MTSNESNKARLEAIASMFEAVRLRKSAVALACLAACSTAIAQSSTRFYGLPLVSEMPASTSNCVNSDAEAIAYANTQWAQNGTKERSAVQVYQCNTTRTVASTSTSDSLKDLVLGNLLTVTPTGTIYYTARTAGTYEKTTASTSAQVAPAPSSSSSSSPPDLSSASPAPSPSSSATSSPAGDSTPYASSPSPAPAPVEDSCWWCYSPPAPEPAYVYNPPPAPAPVYVYNPPPAAAAPAPADNSGNCLWTNTCGGSENTAEEWGPNVWLSAPAPPPASGGGSGWSWGWGYWEQP